MSSTETETNLLNDLLLEPNADSVPERHSRHDYWRFRMNESIYNIWKYYDYSYAKFIYHSRALRGRLRGLCAGPQTPVLTSQARRPTPYIRVTQTICIRSDPKLKHCVFGNKKPLVSALLVCSHLCMSLMGKKVHIQRPELFSALGWGESQEWDRFRQIRELLLFRRLLQHFPSYWIAKPNFLQFVIIIIYSNNS